MNVSHLFFVDDALTFGQVSRAQWDALHVIIKRFGENSSMIFNGNKSFLLYSNGEVMDIEYIHHLLRVGINKLEDSLTYLGYHLKLNIYKIRDWSCLMDKFLHRMDIGNHKWLSLGGRYTLIQSVLQQLSVYWSHLFSLSKAILKNIRSIVTPFLWFGTRERNKYHLVIWEKIVRPKDFGGWGLLNMNIFGWALLIKSLWRAFFHSGIW